jgi:hypothetical protein
VEGLSGTRKRKLPTDTALQPALAPDTNTAARKQGAGGKTSCALFFYSPASSPAPGFPSRILNESDGALIGSLAASPAGGFCLGRAGGGGSGRRGVLLHAVFFRLHSRPVACLVGRRDETVVPIRWWWPGARDAWLRQLALPCFMLLPVNPVSSTRHALVSREPRATTVRCHGLFGGKDSERPASAAAHERHAARFVTAGMAATPPRGRWRDRCSGLSGVGSWTGLSLIEELQSHRSMRGCPARS